MRHWINGIAIGGLLWGMWVLLWRGASWPVLAVGGVFPLGILLGAVGGRLRLEFPVSAWWRLDLWAAFGLAVTALVVKAVARTGWAILIGRIQPGVIAIPIRVRSEMGQLLLLWAITVTPGTIALLVEGDIAYVHCLDQPSQPRLPAIERVERLLVGLWG
ncbi:MAG: Na+/H+ antiporter subunit E [Candidatus Bipolaricaulota bacterium]|nr:Na+/H+ antiporter subunit E [Candidatus Bipolaricaulota bacterium]